MFPNKRIAAFSLILLLGYIPVLCPGDEISSCGQQIFEKYHGAVVTVQVNLRSSYSKDGRASPPTESKYELTGTVVDPSGLIVLAHSGCDPGEFYKSTSSVYEGYKVESEISDLKILLDDNTEVPAEIVLRDRDHDLAFARPKTMLGRPWKAVDLTKPGSAKVLDQVLAFNRLNSVSGRAYSASVARIIAVVVKPRPFYLHDGTSPGFGLGSPVFSLDGNLLGVAVMRVSGAKGANDDENSVSIITPTEQVLKAAKQVPSVRAKAEKEEKREPDKGLK
jgi:S1-C subfamily serine protease